MIQENYTLTEEQIQQFETFGFVIRRQVFSAEEMAGINDEFSRRRESILSALDSEEKKNFRSWPIRNPETP